MKIPVDGEIEHMLEQGQFAVDRRAGYLLTPVEFVSFDVRRRDVGKLVLGPKEFLQRLQQLLIP